MRLAFGTVLIAAVVLAFGCRHEAVDVAKASPASSNSAAEDFAPVFEPAPEKPSQPKPLAVEPVTANTGSAAPVVGATTEPSTTTAAMPAAAPATAPAPTMNGPTIFATLIASTVYRLPDVGSRRLGYIRLGGGVPRDPQPVSGVGCKGQWYRVKPFGFVCTDEATIDPMTPLVRATQRRADLSSALPYRYGFVRATAPQYLRVPTKKEQLDSEFKLEEHLQWYSDNFLEVQRPALGAVDVPVDAHGMPTPGLPLPPGRKLSTQLSLNELFGGAPGDPGPPWWLDGGRKIANVSGFEAPDYALFADRVRRKTGLSFVDAFVAKDEGMERRFAVTVDMRLIPTTKIKPDMASMFHGVAIDGDLRMPFAFVITRDARTWKLIKGEDTAKADEEVPHRALVPLTGKARIKDGRRFYQLARDPKRWLQASDLGVVETPPSWPSAAEKGEKWIDISLVQQVLVLYEGKKPVYATLVSTGQDRLGDPKTSKATPRGEFRIRSKHIAAAMDSEENSNVFGGQRAEQAKPLDDDASATVERLTKAEKEGERLSEEDQRRLLNIKKGRHPEYGVTKRRGSQNFELRDVPWIQYFASGYAIHGAYWHDVFGIPRSHGCVNLSPIDARYVFFWTTPQLPQGFHGINTGEEVGEGTAVVIRE